MRKVMYLLVAVITLFSLSVSKISLGAGDLLPTNSAGGWQYENWYSNYYSFRSDKITVGTAEDILILIAENTYLQSDKAGNITYSSVINFYDSSNGHLGFVQIEDYFDTVDNVFIGNSAMIELKNLAYHLNIYSYDILIAKNNNTSLTNTEIITELDQDIYSRAIDDDRLYAMFSASNEGIFDYAWEIGFIAGTQEPNEDSYNEGYADGTTYGYQNGYTEGIAYAENNDLGFILNLLTMLFGFAVNLTLFVLTFEVAGTTLMSIGVYLVSIFLPIIVIAMVRKG